MKKLGIVAYRCRKCGKIHYPYHDRCIQCKGRDFEKMAPQGNARLVTFTQIFNLPWGFDSRFLVLGVVEFENCIKAMGQIQVEDVSQLKTGMVLKPTWDVIRILNGEKIYGLVLHPA